MKTQGIIYLLALLFVMMSFPTAGDSLDVKFARAFGAKAKAVFRVVDDDGKPVEGAHVGAGFYMNKKVGENPTASAITDKKGVCEIEGTTVSSLKYSVKKDGYYETHGRLWFAGTLKESGKVEDGKWQPYGKTYTVTLKPKKNPIPLKGFKFAKHIQLDTSVGFDLQANDYVKPYGKGELSDFLVVLHDERLDMWRVKAQLSLVFTNALDGAYIRTKDGYSDFVSDYVADTNQVYRKSFFFEYDKLNSSSKRDTSLQSDQYLILRTRTKVDQDGKLIKAHYSKIYGPFQINHQGLEFRSYFNPTVNDLNLESKNEVIPR